MKKVLILYTGGTIGMDYTDNGLSVVHGLFRSQLQQLAPVANVMVDLIEYESLIDSSDISVANWVQMVDDITKAYNNYDGFVIVHGTDTMAYTASILAFALRGLNKPVILTGAQLPLVHRRSDGWSNLIDALYSATQSDLHEVAISFNHKLFRGCRSLKVSTDRFIGFNSVDESPLAEFGININWYKKHWQKNTEEFSPIRPKPVKVLGFSLYPGYTTDFIAESLLKTDAAGVVLRTYGSGNVPMKHKSLTKAFTSAYERGVIITNISQVSEGMISANYGNGQLDKFGVVSGGDMTTEGALAKLTVLLSTDMSTSSIRAAMSKNLVGELTESYD